MGNTTKLTSKQDFLDVFRNQFKLEKEIDDERFGKVKIFNSPNAFKVFVKPYDLQSYQWIKDQKRLCESRQAIKHQNLLALFGLQAQLDHSFCTEMNKLDCFGEFYENNLELEIDKRFVNKQYFPEEDIWLVIHQILQVELELQKYGYICGDLRPINIFLTQTGDIKIFDQQLLPQGLTGYEKYMNLKSKAYLSPEEFLYAKQRIKRPKNNALQSEIFAFGATVLQMIVLGHVGCFHDYSRQQVNRKYIDESLTFAKTIYSKFLCNMIEQCLQEDSNARPDFIEIQAVLQPYEDSIQKGQKFQPSYDKSKQSLSRSPLRAKSVNPGRTKNYQRGEKAQKIKRHHKSGTRETQFTEESGSGQTQQTLQDQNLEQSPQQTQQPQLRPVQQSVPQQYVLKEIPQKVQQSQIIPGQAVLGSLQVNNIPQESMRMYSQENFEPILLSQSPPQYQLSEQTDFKDTIYLSSMGTQNSPGFPVYKTPPKQRVNHRYQVHPVNSPLPYAAQRSPYQQATPKLQTIPSDRSTTQNQSPMSFYRENLRQNSGQMSAEQSQRLFMRPNNQDYLKKLELQSEELNERVKQALIQSQLTLQQSQFMMR